MPEPPLLNPSDIDFDASPVNFALAQRRAAQMRAVQSLDDSPDDAGRADQMARATGAQPALVYGDLENFEKQYKASLTSEILEHNQYLRDYVAAHPLAAKVSNDDWGSLDKYTSALAKIGLGQAAGALHVPGVIQSAAQSIAQKAMEGFKAGFGEDEIGPQIHNFLGNSGIINTLFSVFQTNPAYYAPRIMQGLMYGGAAAAGQAATSITGSEAWGNRLTRDLLIAPQVAIPELAGGIVPAELQALAQKTAVKGEPWVKMGRVPPPGTDPDFDAVHKEQVKLDMDNIDEAHKLLQQSGTLQRSPELAQLLGRIVTNGSFEVKGEAVRKLYGGKPGEPIEAGVDDGKLGFIPNLQEQLALAEKHNGDVSVPIADWMAKVSPELHEELKPFIRPRPDGMTLEEAKAEGPKVEEPIAPVEPIQALRQGAGIAPTELKGPIYERPVAEEGIIPDRTETTTIAHDTGEATARTFPATEALKRIDQDRLSGVSKALYQFFSDHIDRIAGDTPVHVLGLDDMRTVNKQLGHPEFTAGFYHSGLHTILLADDVASGQYGHTLAAQLITEEVAHAASMREMEAFPKLKAAVRGLMNEADSWLQANNPEVRQKHSYAFTNETEFWARPIYHEDFPTQLAQIPMSDALKQRLKNVGIAKSVNNIWEAIRELVRVVLSRLSSKTVPDSILDGFFKLGPEFEAASKQLRIGMEGKTARAEVTPGSTADIESKIRGLMPRGLLDRYMEKIEKQQAENAKFQEVQAKKRSTETQTKEWKQNFADMRDKVRDEMRNRADIAADRLFREGDLFGQKVGKVKLDSARLTDEQKAGLPKEYYGAGGENPDSMANAFGYRTGDAMVNALVRVQQERELEGLTPAAHLGQLVDAETDRRMRKEYGSLDEQIAKEMEDHIISPTQIDLLHDKLAALHMAAKVNEPLRSVGNMRMAAKELFDKLPWVNHTKAGYFADSNRAWGRLRDAALKDDAIGMFKAQQEQIYSLILADEAGKLEKENVRDQRLIKKYSARAPGGVDPETSNYIHDIMMRTFGVMRTKEDLLRQRSLVSTHKDFEDFVTSVNSDDQIWNQDPNAMPIVQRLPVPDFLLDPDYKQDPEKMSVEEKRAVMAAIRAMDKYGRTVKKYGERDLDEVRDGLIERLKAAVDNKKISKGPDQPTSVFRTIGSYVLNPETWFNRLDLGNRQGPFNQLIMRPIVEGQYTLKTLERQFAKEWREIGEFGDLRKKIDNPLFKDTDGSLLELNRGHLMSIISNMGNALQRKKLAGGYGIDNPDKIWNWLWSLAQKGEIRKEDFDRAGAMGKFFERIFEKSEGMYAELTGVTPERIPLGTIQTPWGEMPEWYHPLIPNPLKWAPKKASDMYEESGYYKPATATGYTKKRTGAIYPIQLNFDAIPGKIKQMLNDIAMHPAITEVNKILGDRKFKDAFAQYYGKEYAQQLEPWLRDAAGQRRYDPGRLQGLETAVHYLQENMSTLLIGFNIFGTVPKHFFTALGFSMHEVGSARFMDSMFHILGETDQGKTRWRNAMDESEEIQNRLRSMQESVSATNRDLFKQYNWGTKFFKIRDFIQTAGAAPVAASDFISSIIMWDAAYRKFLEENPGASHGDAVYDANTAVRRTHGSTIISNRPAIMRANPWVNTFMPFYNFANNAANRLHEYGWQAKLAMQGRSLPEMTGFEKEEFEKGRKNVPQVLGGLLMFGFFWSMVENVIDPLPPDPDHPIKQGAKMITRGPLGMLPFVRDIVAGSYGGHDPSAGIVGTAYRDIAKPLGNLHISDPARAIKDINNAWGALTGLTYAPMGNVGSYIYKLGTGQEVPHDPLDLIRGYRYGTQRVRK